MKLRTIVNAMSAAALLASPVAASAADADAGRAKFNSNCGACHGEDAVQQDPAVNLRLLNQRHGEKASEVFAKTTRDGKADVGMPSWDGVLSPEDLADIEAFVKTVQTP